MMQIPATVPEQIEQIKEMEISYRTMHDNMLITDNAKGKNILVPFVSLTNKYRDFLAGIIKTIELTKADQRKYRYKPKSLSFDLYGSTEFWSDLLVLNKCYSIAMFQPEKVNVYDPAQFKTLLNEIMILETNEY